MRNRNQRPAKPIFRRDHMAEAIRKRKGTEFGRYLAGLYPNLKVRLGFNDAMDGDVS